MSKWVLKEKRIHLSFYLGFALALIGIAIISFQGNEVAIDPLGDILAILAAFVWACYAVLSKKISSFGYPTIPVTRRIFAYGLLWMLPVIFLQGMTIQVSYVLNPDTLFHLLFLGLGASALCFVTWNFSVKVLGALRTSVYIYMVPVITVFASALVLQEQVTWSICIGTCLILLGLCLSEYKQKER